MSSETLSEEGVPDGYVPFARVREALPDTQRIPISEAVTLETLFLPGPAPEIVFVHGGLGSLWNPYPQLHAFRGEQGLLTYALAGNGRSSTRSEQTLRGHVADLRRLVEQYSLDSPIIHGHSYGTAVALEYAKHHPCDGLVLHAGADHDLTPSWEKPLLRLILATRLYRLPLRGPLMQILARWAACHEETPDALIDDFLQSNPMPRRRSAWETVTEAFWGYDGRQDIARITVPTLVIHGLADRIVSLETVRTTAQRIPTAAFCSVERSGHIAMAERPAAYNRLLQLLIDAVRHGKRVDATIPARV